MIPTIPQSEYFERIAKFQKRIKAAGLDACLVHGTESDFANVRYLTEYWPTFEQAGVFVPAEGKAVLLIGPESLKYAQGRSVVPEIAQLRNPTIQAFLLQHTPTSQSRLWAERN